MQFTEVFMGIQQGTIDGEENPYMNIVGNNIQEVQDYVVETNHLGHIITFYMNNELYQSEYSGAFSISCPAIGNYYSG